MNCLYTNNKTNQTYELLCLLSDIIDNSNFTINKNIIITPKYRLWTFRYEFLKYYKRYITRVKTYEKNKIKKCPLCDFEDTENKIYYNINNKICWGSLTFHLMKKHNYQPKDRFIKFILSLSSDTFFKIKMNDMVLFDGLMNAGGRMQKFKLNHKFKTNKNKIEKKTNYFNSEYSGYLDIECKNKICQIENIEISNFRRFETDIYMVNFFIDRLADKKYIFHTHPPTPNAGSRIQKDRIVYEFPSFDDINSFVEMKQYYDLEGELIFAPEGIYVLMVYDKKKELKNEKFKDKNEYLQILNEAYYEYKNISNEKEFYEKVAQDYKYIKKANDIIKEYNLTILYFPREKLNDNSWIYGKIYLPIRR